MYHGIPRFTRCLNRTNISLVLTFGIPAMNEEQQLLRTFVSNRATEELKKLLEEKHLYQKFKLDPAPEAARLNPRVANPALKHRYLAWATSEFPKEKFSLFIHQFSLVSRTGIATQPAPAL